MFTWYTLNPSTSWFSITVNMFQMITMWCRSISDESTIIKRAASYITRFHIISNRFKWLHMLSTQHVISHGVICYAIRFQIITNNVTQFQCTPWTTSWIDSSLEHDVFFLEHVSIFGNHECMLIVISYVTIWKMSTYLFYCGSSLDTCTWKMFLFSGAYVDTRKSRSVSYCPCNPCWHSRIDQCAIFIIT